MNFMFLYPTIMMGGIETLMARMSKWLTENGHEVSILCGTIDKKMHDTFSDKVRITAHRTFYKLHRKTQRYICSLVNDTTQKPVDVVIAFNPRSLTPAFSIARSLPNACRIVAGIWAEKWYCNYSIKAIIEDPGNLIFHELLPSGSRMYMSQILQKRVEETGGRKVPGVIWPLPVDGGRFMSVARKPVRGKIVSVGRLGVMKEYNIGMIDVVRELLSEGHDVKWYVYGDGPYRGEMEKKIAYFGLNEKVQIMGNVDYDKMHSVLQDAWLFVGMGTAMIEASFAKVPSIAVVPYEETPTTHGYFHELPEYNVGEMLDEQPKKFCEVVKHALLVDSDEYEELGRSCFDRAQIFGLEKRMIEFMRNLESIECYRWKKKTPIKYKAALILRAINRRMKSI